MTFRQVRDTTSMVDYMVTGHWREEGWRRSASIPAATMC